MLNIKKPRRKGVVNDVPPAESRKSYFDKHAAMANLYCSGAIADGRTAAALDAALLVADGSCPQIRELLRSAEAPVLWLDGQEPPLQAVSRALAERGS